MIVSLTPAVAVPSLVRTKLFAAAGATSTFSRSPPAAEIVPSVVSISTVSSVYSIIVPDATPLLNGVVVPVPKLVPANVGTLPAGDVDAPENVSVLFEV